MLTELQKSLISIDFFKKGVSLQLRLRWGNVLSYALDHLHSTPHYLRSWKVFPAVRTIYVSPTCQGMRLSFLERHWMTWSLSGWLDAIELAPPLYRRQSYHWYWSELLAR